MPEDQPRKPSNRETRVKTSFRDRYDGRSPSEDVWYLAGQDIRDEGNRLFAAEILRELIESKRRRDRRKQSIGKIGSALVVAVLSFLSVGVLKVVWPIIDRVVNWCSSHFP